MLRITAFVVLAVFAVLALWGCSSRPDFVAKYEPWREEDEKACLSAGVVRETRFIEGRSALGGPSVCGAARPFSMSGTADGRVMMAPAALLRCPMVPAIEFWIKNIVEPAAHRYLGAPVVEIKVAASYACRPMNHKIGGRLSEHGHANALDVAEFHLADGRRLTVKAGWWGSNRERAFLRAVHQGACDTFTTVLGPNYDRLHHDHFHMDLARHGADQRGRICK